MASKITLRIITLLLVGLSLFACKQKYFIVPSDSITCNQFCCLDEFDPSEYEKYSFRLKPYDIYKNNNQTTLLLSPNGSLVHYKKFFYLESSQNHLDKTPSYYLLDNWYNLDFYITKHPENLVNPDTSHHIFHEGDRIYIRSISGKTDSTTKEEKAKLIHTFEGKIGKSVIGDPNSHIVLIDHMTKINSSKDLKKMELENELKNKDGLAFIISQKYKKDTFDVGAIIDIDYHNKNETSEIYDLKDIFGEPIMLIRTR